MIKNIDLNSIYAVFSKPIVIGLLAILTIALITDLTTNRISNKLILLGLLLGFALQVIFEGLNGSLNWLHGVSLGFIGFLPLYILKGMAAGDVKLMMAVGGFLGYPLIIPALIFTIIFGGIFAIVYTVFKGRLSLLCKNLYDMAMRVYLKSATKVSLGDTVDQNISAGKMPYALAIATGTLTAVIFYGHGKLI